MSLIALQALTILTYVVAMLTIAGIAIRVANKRKTTCVCGADRTRRRCTCGAVQARKLYARAYSNKRTSMVAKIRISFGAY